MSPREDEEDKTPKNKDLPKQEKDKFRKPKNNPYRRIKGNIDWIDKEDDDDVEF